MGHNFKKQFGQNFLKSSKFPNVLVDALQLSKDDVVIEIGPGAGVVTNLVLKTGARVLAVEIDYDLIPKLIGRFNDQKNFSIVYADILALDVIKALNEKNIQSTAIKVVGSLPYNISKKIIRKFLDLHYSQTGLEVKAMSFIVQDEVAKEYVAKAPTASFLSISTQLRAKFKKLVSIPASQFIPKPKVNGGIIVIEPFESSLQIDEHLIKLIKIGYSSPRKVLINNLKNSKKFKSSDIEAAFKTLNLLENTRASELTVEDWKKLYALLTPAL